MATRRRARPPVSSSARRTIAVIGIWLVFGPAMLMLFGTMVEMLSSLPGGSEHSNLYVDAFVSMLGMAILVAATAVFGALLYKTTRNYIRWRATAEPPDVDEDEVDDEGGNGGVGERATGEDEHESR